MNSGFFLPISSNYKLAWLWGIILMSLGRVLYFEIDHRHVLFLSIWFFICYAAFLVLIWPHRFFIAEERMYFSVFPRLRLQSVELKYVTAVNVTRFGFSFSYAGKRFQFFTFGKSKQILRELVGKEVGLDEKKAEA